LIGEKISRHIQPMVKLSVIRGRQPLRRRIPRPKLRRPLWYAVGMAAFVGVALGGLMPLMPATGTAAGTITGAAKATDGDTLEIAGQKVRLLGLDAPEGKQVCQRDGREWRCGDGATLALRSLVAGRAVVCEVKGHDRYQRALAVCTAGGMDVAREMVRRGLAVAYYPARGVRGPSYEAEEAEAEAAQRGLWGGSFVRPSDWRKGER
jgi:endonuclease YncB( thermonuclease family)